MATSAFLSNGQSISGELFSPLSGPAWPTVVVAYGTEQMNAPFGQLIRDFSSELAAKGLLAFIPDYFASTNTPPGLESVFSPNGAQARFNRWIAVLTDAITYVQGIAGVAVGRTALVGFSLGGHLVLRAAAGPYVKAVVDFFGPIATVGSAITPSISKTLPPVQIHHGEKDVIVHYRDSESLDTWLNSHTVPHEFCRYPSNGHPGQERFQPPGWSAESQALATKEAVRFLSKNV